jgi:hypothetical protein
MIHRRYRPRALGILAAAVVAAFGVSPAAGATVLAAGHGFLGMVCGPLAEPGVAILTVAAVLTATGRPGAFPRR